MSLLPYEVLASLDVSPADVVNVEGGQSGFAWQVRNVDGPMMLRFCESTPLMESRLAAMESAARAGLPVPRPIRYGTSTRGAAVLLSWLSGTTLFDTMARNPDRIRSWGHLLGETQRRLHEVTAPPEVWTAGDDRHTGQFESAHGIAGLPTGQSLLHLDLHPSNLLVREDGALGGILDWDNARRGHPFLDLARTHTMLTIEPAIAGLPAELRTVLPEFHAAWAEGYGPESSGIPQPCLAWAARVMLAELEPRYAADPGALDNVRRHAKLV